mgnify:CR=1 FL=1
MAEVKPAEVSAILKQQLAGFKTEAQLEEVGTVLQVGDGIARIYGLSEVQAGELIEIITEHFINHTDYSDNKIKNIIIESSDLSLDENTIQSIKNKNKIRYCVFKTLLFISVIVLLFLTLKLSY